MELLGTAFGVPFCIPRSEKLDVVRLTFYTAPVSLACLLPFYWLHEVSRRCNYVAAA